MITFRHSTEIAKRLPRSCRPDCTVVLAIVAAELPADRTMYFATPGDDDISGLDFLYSQAGAKFYGYL